MQWPLTIQAGFLARLGVYAPSHQRNGFVFTYRKVVVRTTIGLLLVLFMGLISLDARAAGFSECVKDAYPLPTTGLKAFRNGQEKLLDADIPGAAAHYLQAAEEGNWQAELALIELFLHRFLYEEDMPQLGQSPDARLTRLVKQGIPEAAAMRASSGYWSLYGRDEDTLELLKKAANMGSRTAQLVLGLGPVPGFTDTEIEACLRCAYSQGSRHAAGALSPLLLEKGQIDEALEVAHTGAVLGDITSLVVLREVYERIGQWGKAKCLQTLSHELKNKDRNVPVTEALYPYLGTIPNLDELCP